MLRASFDRNYGASDMTSINTKAAREALETERARLVHQLEELGADESGELTGEVDFGDAFADAGAATAERTETLGLIENLTDTLKEVDVALGKLDDGSYGICVSCGKPIGAARLEFRPESVMCVDCKSART